ncbi:hypothetical protein M011DRAFT_471244 [Sporormia fimetaria CBS 119925]|uniref:J domain-containing protein n=1 Tax=Sporormia fimetaria CBS 119925 TaxID=1340428 RepID=A0A6A6UZK2_9PLEO|nr:hypothetical protein M011DRAFT_471244 [Sporormia fimetaria CBS 119925]
MASKTPAVLLCSPFSVAACSSAHPCRHLLSYTPALRQTRLYAQHAQYGAERRHRPDHHSHCHDEHAWPEATAPHRVPTPYQILALRRGEVYTKRRFYALAKLYHPDSCVHASSPIARVPHAVRLERYRLIVAAHGILSDDSKRKAYDLWGSGWSEHPHSHVPTHSYTPPEYSSSRSWSTDPNLDPFQNATWEDWERWRRRAQEGETDEGRTVYMSNFAFISMVFFLVSLGLVVQGTRASSLSLSALKQREKIHKEASMQLARSQRATMATGDRDERVRTFVEHRQATLAGQPSNERLLPPADNCAPESVGNQ